MEGYFAQIAARNDATAAWLPVPQQLHEQDASADFSEEVGFTRSGNEVTGDTVGQAANMVAQPAPAPADTVRNSVNRHQTHTENSAASETSVLRPTYFERQLQRTQPTKLTPNITRPISTQGETDGSPNFGRQQEQKQEQTEQPSSARWLTPQHDVPSGTASSERQATTKLSEQNPDRQLSSPKALLTTGASEVVGKWQQPPTTPMQMMQPVEKPTEAAAPKPAEGPRLVIGSIRVEVQHPKPKVPNPAPNTTPTPAPKAETPMQGSTHRLMWGLKQL